MLKSQAEMTQIDRLAVRIYMEDVARQIPLIVEKLHQAGIDPVSLTLTQPTLDDVFLQVTGNTLDGEQTKTAIDEQVFA
jgi:hypothetical protein